MIGLLLTTFVCGQTFYSISRRRRRYYAPCGKEDRTKMNGVFTYAHIPDMRLNDEEEKTAKN
eukprot:scaffold14521_cov152-Skeletonema_dohrnii-CCMP3373.AAC.2